jgi:hypothetical protein
MESSNFQCNCISNSKPKEKLVIPSSVVSRICSPSPNFIDIPDFENSVNNFTTQCDLRCHEESLPKIIFTEEDDIRKKVVTEIESIKEELKLINVKLEQNIDSLKKHEDSEPVAKFLNLIEKKRMMKSEKNEALCSCTKQCKLF